MDSPKKSIDSNERTAYFNKRNKKGELNKNESMNVTQYRKVFNQDITS
jgi:hypothetical protein